MSVRPVLYSVLWLSASVVALGAASPAFAQGSAPAAPAVTETAVDNLLQGLVDQGVLTKKKAGVLANKFHSDLRNAPSAAPQAVAAPVPAAVPAAEPAANVVRVPYVSQTVQDSITDRVKTAVMAQAKDEHWATPNSYPDWIGHIRLFGDVRVRDEGRFFGKNNESDFVDTATANAGSALDINPASAKYAGLPILNTTQNRNYERLRARFGILAQVDDDLSAVIRLATGNDTSPTSTNQTLGSDFGKKAIWLDQAYISYQPSTPWGLATLTLGRMPNPFDKTEMVWDEDINPDGVAASFGHEFGDTGFSLKATAAAFTLDGTSDNAPANALSTDKNGESTNRWMFGGQLGGHFVNDRWNLGLDAAYYDYDGVQSTLSAPCTNIAAAQLGCPTDATRPTFMQKGNTLFLLRNITDPNNTGADPQYFGLASKFQVLDFLANVSYRAKDDIFVTLTGDYAKNLGYNSAQIQALPIINNNETCSVSVGAGQTCASAGGTGLFKDGDTAWFAKLTVGNPVILKRWDWNVSFSYENIQPDALLDAFTDSDFHLGGTNAKGFTLGANLGVAKNTWLTAKWLSADAVSGPPLAIDVAQFDLTTRF